MDGVRGQHGARYQSARDVARIYRWKLSYVYKLASRDGWPRIRVGGEVRYRVEAVQATFDGASTTSEVKNS